MNRLVNEAVERFSQHPKIVPKKERKPTLKEEDSKPLDQSQPPTELTTERTLSPVVTRSATAPLSEQISASVSVAEEIPEDAVTSKGDQSTVIHTEQTTSAKVPTEYEGDTFESLDTTLTHPHHPPIITSTPEHLPQEQDKVPQPQRLDDISLSDSLKITSSIGI